MRSILMTFILLSFLGVAGLGFAAMSHQEGGHKGCPAFIVEKIDCPAAVNSVNFAVFHLDVFKKFSTAVFPISIYIFIAFFALLFFIPNFIRTSGDSDHSYFTRLFLLPESSSLSFEIKNRQWLARHENSPAVFSAPM